MRILRMKATFGCLDEAELILEPGLNVLIRPNEQGKSTWAAFLVAMFYGIDTTQRSSKGHLPEKTKYLPWSGKAMSGILELEHRGRVVVLQRTSSRTRPMGELQVYDKVTGLPLKEVTADCCGEYFLGVERSVFQRSAFLNGEEPSVTQDSALSQRLEQLAAGGDGTDSYPEAAARLKQWKNKLRYHQSGLLPKVERQLLEKEQALLSLQAIGRRQEEASHALTQSRETIRRLEEEETLRWQWEKDRTAAALTEAITQWETRCRQHPAETNSRTIGSALWLILAALTACLAIAVLRQTPWWWLLIFLWCGCLCLLSVTWRRARKKDLPKTDTEQARQAVEQARLAHELALLPLSPSAERLEEQEKAAAWQAELIRLEKEQAVLTGREDPEVRRKELEQTHLHLLQQEQALALAQEALDAAQARQEQVYAPHLTKSAGEYLSRLTAGKYGGLILEPGFTLRILENRTGLARRLDTLSSGTQNQVWLALRLAMTTLLLPEGTPIWLDDALMTFDENRTELALRVLSEENRQVILMCCK